MQFSSDPREDVARRDFTVNAMAISLNEGSFGLLMDPLNGAADIEARTLRLVSNYGFIEEPSLMIRATRYHARLGWELDPKTRSRYDNAKAEGMIEFLSSHGRSQELEQIGHEEDGLNVMRALEAEGWMKVLFPAWTPAKADEEKLKALHELAVGLLLQGVHADMSAAQMQLLTAKMQSKDLSALKDGLLRPGFVEEWNSLDALAAGFQKVLLSKENTTPSNAYKLFTTYDPEAVLWLGFTSKNAGVQDRFNQFLKVWPEARQGIPHALMQEMRITPELAGYNDIVHAVFLELIDGRLTTPEEMRAFLEPHSPPAPPPQVTIKRPRVKRGAEKIKEQTFDDDEESEDALSGDDDLDDIGGDEDEIDLGLSIPKGDLEDDALEEGEPGEDDLDADEEEPVRASAKSSGKKSAAPEPAKKTAKTAPAPIAEKAAKANAGKAQPTPVQPAPTLKPPAPPVASKGKQVPAPDKGKAAPAAKKPAAAPVTAKVAKAAAKPPIKAAAKVTAKPAAKAPIKVQAKPAPKPVAKGKPSQGAKAAKPAAKKPAPKPKKKR